MIKTILLISIISLCITVGCLDISERQIEHYIGFVEEVDYIPESLWVIGRTIISFSDGNVLVVRGVHGIPRNQTINISYYKEEWNNREPYYRFVSVEII